MHYIDRLDRYRESYYRYHTGRQWKRIENYDLCLDTAAMGLDNCIEVIKKIVELRFGVKAPQSPLGFADRTVPQRGTPRSV